MFTGIVQAQGRVASLEPTPTGARLRIDPQGWTPSHSRPLRLGDSLCVSGVCLTVADIQADTLAFDVIPETLSRTTLGELVPDSRVNLEPAVTPDQPLGGHFMQGHVDGVGVVTQVHRSEQEYRLRIEPPAELMDYLSPKGSIAVDGVSLTIAALDDQAFEVALIPATLELTTLSQRQAGDRVNLEADIISKTVVHYLRRWQGGRDMRDGGRDQPQPPITWQLLREADFIQD